MMSMDIAKIQPRPALNKDSFLLEDSLKVIVSPWEALLISGASSLAINSTELVSLVISCKVGTAVNL